LEQHPDILPASDINPLLRAIVPIGRQVTAGVNCIDLLFLADTGHLIVIECKLIKNPEARREVVPQLLEYYLSITTSWNSKHVMSIAEEYLLRSSNSLHKDQTVTTQLNTILESKTEQPLLTEAILKKRIDRQIKNPILVIAGNRLDPRALVLSDFLRTLKVPMFCLEVRRYRAGKACFVTGQVRAASLLSTISVSQRETITEEEWLSIDNDEALQIVRRDFLDWAKSLADQCIVDMRIGSTELMIDVTKRDKTRNVLSLSTRLFINFLSFRELVGSEESVEKYRERIESTVGLGVLGQGRSWPSIPLVSLTDDAKRNALKIILEAFIREATGTP
jgi:hypothetical protein